MADFFQSGVVATLHNLDPAGEERLDAELRVFAPRSGIGLVLPALIGEFRHQAMDGIIRELAQVRWLRRIVVAIGDATRAEYAEARARFDRMPTPVTALWLEDPRIAAILADLTAAGVDAGPPGKGRTCWLAYGLLLAAGDCDIIALHDCDIRDYHRRLLTRLCYPVAHPGLGFEFAKGYYARVSDGRLRGRVMRLFLTPVIRALRILVPNAPYLQFLDSFRYALSGEFAIRADLLRLTRVPSDWGLEVGFLSEVYRNTSLPRICQVDIADNYDHKHHELGAGDSSAGLRRMAVEIGKVLFRALAAEGIVLGEADQRTLAVLYLRTAQDMINRYAADATLNGFAFDRHEEGTAAFAFAECLQEAAAIFNENPLRLPIIPNWNRVLHAIPDIFERLQHATADMATGSP